MRINHKQLLIFLLATLVTSINSHSQEKEELLQTISNQICECLETDKIKDPNKMDICFETSILKNLDGVLKIYNIKKIDDFDANQFGLDIGVLLMKTCQYALEHLTPSEYKIEDDFVPKEDLNCTQLKRGDYFYVFPNQVTKGSDTTYVTIKDKMYLERMQNGRTYSMLDIKWINDCKFDLIFKDSNDEIKSRLSKPGDVYHYEVIETTPNSYIIKTTWMKQTFKFELVKLN
jgi:hypothetical protein